MEKSKRFEWELAKLISRASESTCSPKCIRNSITYLSRKNSENNDFDVSIPVTRFPCLAASFKSNPKQTLKSLEDEKSFTGLFPFIHYESPHLFLQVDRAKLFKYAVLDGSALLKSGLEEDIEDARQKVLVEYASPNIAKPFHAGHFRSIALGNFLCNLFRKQGHDVTSINYLGDWGKQYGLLVEAYKRYGSDSLLKENPLDHLVNLYVRINAEAEKDPTLHDVAKENFRTLEQAQESNDLYRLWKQFREISLRDYRHCYEKDLNVYFDAFEFESSVCLDGTLAKVLKQLEKCNLLSEHKSMIGVKCQESNWFAPLLKPDGSSLYLSRDLATIHLRYEKYKFDRMLYVTGAAQSFHFKQLFTILKMMKAPFAQACEHVAFGSVSGMSSRKGNVVLLRDMINQAKDISLERLQNKFVSVEKNITEMPESEVAKRVSIAAITIQDGKGRRLKDYSFDWNRILDTSGDTGAFILYTQTKLASLRRKNADLIYPISYGSIRHFHMGSNADLSKSSQGHFHILCLLLLRYPKVIHGNCSNFLDPSPLVNYLFELCRMIVKALAVLPIKSEPNLELRLDRAALFYRCELVLDDSLSLLNIQSVPYM